MKKIDNLLIELSACHAAIKWAKNKSWLEIYSTCNRVDWLLWLFARTNSESLKELALAKGHCANTVRYLMLDKRSVRAVDIAIAFGEGNATLKELNAAYAAAYAA